MLLVGDIGGTRARLAIVSADDGLTDGQTVESRRYGGLVELVAEYQRSTPAELDRAVFAVAGPVIGGRAELTNLRWVLEEEQLREALHLRSVRLLNDLVATASAVPHLEADALRTLQRGTPEERGAMAVVAPGTGLGEAFSIWDGTRYRAYPSEAGHADFAPTDALQRELLGWLQTRFDHVSYERVCSGRGLPNLYEFLTERGDWREHSRVTERLAATEDRTPVIIDAALDERTPSTLCVATLELFASILAAEAGNVALRVLATGGLYLGGGLPRRVLPVLMRESFLEHFRRKGRMSPLLARIPLHVIVAPNVALVGAAQVARTEAADVRDT